MNHYSWYMDAADVGGYTCMVPSLHVDLRHAGCAINTIGRRCARMYISWNLGSASERMTLPMDMKKLRAS